MGFCEHFELMAQYNRRMNQQLLQAASGLPATVLEKDLGAFFHSILGTFNHLLVADLMWLGRFAQHREHYESLLKVARYPKPEMLDQIMYDELAELRAVREELDGLISYWVGNELQETDCQHTLTYRNSKGIQSTRQFGELLSHFFNHQTHHRGQLSTLFSQLGIDIGITDFLIDIPDQTQP